MKWVNFLHIYQPPTQSKEIVDKVVRESYTLIPELMKKYPNMRLTMNITGSLLELFDRYGHRDIIDSYRALVKEGRIELTGSALYHPLMPLTSPEMMRRQIKRNSAILKTYFGESCVPRGFYFPEMAYSAGAGEIVKELGFEWTVLDEINAPGQIEPDITYKILDSGLTVVFRNREFSRSFPPEFIISNMNRAPDPLVTAHDGELYGHWHTDDKGFYEKAFTSPNIHMVTVSEHIQELKEGKIIKLRKGSWESTPDEIAARNPFALWNSPDNEVHQKLWDFAHLVEKIVTAHAADDHYALAEICLDKGYASCAWWWANGRKLGPFSPVCWNPSEIEKGALMLLNAVRSLKTMPLAERMKAEKAYTAMHDLIWSTHWARHVQ
ncbi:MAG: hypothetical protein JWO00_223 [Candidatus Parcubacteria bacterium]|nr:hypothetical protein [Candidatus Parcubacteria bacterium]